jgi:hypothetical protein
MPLMEPELITISEYMCSYLVLSGFRVSRSVFFCVLFCRSLLVLLSVFVWSLCYLSFDVRFLNIPFVSVTYVYVYWWRVCEISCSYPFLLCHIPLDIKHTWKVYRLQFQGPTLTLWYVMCWSSLTWRWLPGDEYKRMLK